MEAEKAEIAEAEAVAAAKQAMKEVERAVESTRAEEDVVEVGEAEATTTRRSRPPRRRRGGRRRPDEIKIVADASPLCRRRAGRRVRRRILPSESSSSSPDSDLGGVVATASATADGWGNWKVSLPPFPRWAV